MVAAESRTDGSGPSILTTRAPTRKGGRTFLSEESTVDCKLSTVDFPQNVPLNDRRAPSNPGSFRHWPPLHLIPAMYDP